MCKSYLAHGLLRIAVTAIGGLPLYLATLEEPSFAQAVPPRIVEIETGDLPKVSVKEIDRAFRARLDQWRENKNCPLNTELLPQVVELEPQQLTVMTTRGRIKTAWINGAPIEPNVGATITPQLGTNTVRVELEGVPPIQVHSGRVFYGVDPGSAALLSRLLEIADETLREQPNMAGLVLLPAGLTIDPTATGMRRRMRLSLSILQDGVPFLDSGIHVEAFATSDPDVVRVVASLSARNAWSIPPEAVQRTISADEAHAAIARHFAPAPVHVDEPHLYLVGNNPTRALYRAFVRGPLNATAEADPLAASFTTNVAFVDAADGTIVAIEDLRFNLTVPVVDDNIHDMDIAIQHKTFPHLPYQTVSAVNYYHASGPWARVRNDALAIHVVGTLPSFIYLDGVDLDTTDLDIPLIAPDTATSPLWLLGPGWPGASSLADDQLDVWTAYFQTSRAGYLINAASGFLHNFPPAPGIVATAVHVGVNPIPYSVYTTGLYDPNMEMSNLMAVGAWAVPNLIQLGSTTTNGRSGTFFSRGPTYVESIYNSGLTHVQSDATRDPGIIYHEFMHTVLMGQGFPGTNLSQDERSIHEGISDYGARYLLNGEAQLYDNAYFTPAPQNLNPGKQRYCGTAGPGVPGFIAVDADDPTEVNGIPVDAYQTGSAICQALASAEEELIHVDNQTPERVIDLIVNSIPGWVPAATIPAMIDRIRIDEATGYAIQSWTNPHQFAYLTHLGVHGLVSNAQNPGREAIMTFPEGAWSQTSYSAWTTVPYLIAGGMNDRFTMTFTAPPNSIPCWVENGALSPSLPNLVSHSSSGSIPVSTFLSACGNPVPHLVVDLFTCTGSTDCRGPGVLNVVQMSQRPLAAPLYLNF